MTAAIMVAAGKGTRMGPNVDKLFLEVAGRPIVAHTWQRLEDTPEIASLVIVVREGMESAFNELAAQFGFRKPYQLVHGGKERSDSVWNGLSTLDASVEIAAIQDGARPCTRPELIAETIRAARETGASVAAQRVVDTIKESADGQTIARNVERSKLWAVQTPQTFRVEVIRRALTAVREQGLAITDDTAACELIGQPVRLVDSAWPNPKATSPADLPYLEVLLGQLNAGK